MHVAIICMDKPGHLDVRLANREAHLAFAADWADRIVFGGPMLGPDGAAMVGSLLVVEVPDLAAAAEWTENDPYAKAGLFESVVVRPWKHVLGQYVGK